MTKHIHVIYDVKGWAYYHRASALRKYAPADYEVSIGGKLPRSGRLKQLDLVLVLTPMVNPTPQLARSCPGCVVVGTVNDGWGWRPDRVADLRRRYRYLIFNNWEAYERSGKPPSTYQISNGVDLGVFTSTVPLHERPPNVLWTASAGHKELKGYSLLRSLKGRFAEQGLRLDMRIVNSQAPPHQPAEMAAWYNTGRVFLVASKADGTPNPALEAAACGTPLAATAVGNMPELIADRWNGALLPARTPEAILEAVKYASQHGARLAENMATTIQQWSWQERSTRYFDLFDRLIAGNPPGPEWNRHVAAPTADDNKRPNMDPAAVCRRTQDNAEQACAVRE